MNARAWLATNDRWIPGIIVAGFGVMLVANGIMTWMALSTFGGLATHDYYDRGRTYNATLAAAESQQATGWTASLQTSAIGNGRFLVEARLLASDGLPLHGAEARVRFVRPSDDSQDFDVRLDPAEDGFWRAEIAPGLDGLWEARLFVTRDDQAYAVEERVVLQP